MQKYGGYLQRFLAFLVDGLLSGVFSKFVTFFFPGQQEISNPLSQADRLTNVQTSGQNFIVQLIIGIVPLLFFAYLISSKGFSPGKAIFGLRVQKESGRNLTIGEAIIRELGKIVSIIPLGLGFIWIFFDKKRQAWHDKFVGSVVISSK
ncbi:RDD family protein [Candidatus Gottesmanbacteria bacterium]|nr:RDD family protein [Candidatus Gottesmanbacteria bacterium]